jgi:hypothetical protein
LFSDGWQAFLAAHTNMNRIQQSMQLVPRQVKLALQTLASPRSTPRIITRLLPSTLKEIERLGKNCIIYANNTHNAFLGVMNLLGEVISLTETTRGLAETRLRQTEIELNASRIMQEELSKVGETIRSHYNEAREAVQKAQSEYSRALKKIPTGFKALLLDLGRAVIGIVKAGANAVMDAGRRLAKAVVPLAIRMATGGMSAMLGGFGALSGSVGAIGGLMNGGQGGVSMGQALSFGKLFSTSFGQVVPRLKEILSLGVDGASGSNNPLDELKAYKVTFETFLSSLQAGKDNPLKQQTSRLIERGIGLFEEVSEKVKGAISNAGKVDPRVAGSLNARINELSDQAKPMEAAESANGAEVPPAPVSADASGDSSQNEKFAAQLTMNRLRDAETRYDKIFEHLKQNQEELAKLMGKIATLDMTRIHYKELIELLREVLRLLARVREQWGQLVLFFAEVATKAEIVLGGTLGPFIEQAGQAGSDGLSTDERLFYVDILKAQADDIDVQSGMLFTMARTYYDMSTRFIMQRLAGLSKMLTAANDNERNQLLSELNHNTQDTQAAVLSLVAERKNAYQQAVRRRRAELTDFLAQLGGPDPKNQLAIEAGRELLRTAA